MIKVITIFGLLILLTSSQTTVTPKIQQCACTDLLNQQDCNTQQGCTWISQVQNNSNNSNLTIATGTCSNNTTNSNTSQTQNQTLLVVSQCSIYTNSTICAQSLGCAFFNNSCLLFSGCSAYVQTTNQQCQSISSQCTSDGTRCSDPQPCQSYNTSNLCLDNISTSGAKSCKWVKTGETGQCNDKVCSDAPSKFNTNEQCNGWISGCLTTGQGCTNTLGTCSTYPQAVGCTGMIGSDGPCAVNSDSGSTVCRPLACTDAPSTLLTNADCSKFLSGCLTIGKGCVKTLQSCSAYSQTQTCASLIGSEGPCTIDTTNLTSCRALNCTDAPNTLNTNDGCNQFLKNCLTTGQGCIKTLGLCSSYTGTDAQCNLYIGSDGNCKGTGTTASQCQARKCDDAPKTINTDSGCNQYQKGCITNGAGCVVSLQLCQSYIGTATTCLSYKGSDGNCMAASTQTSDGPCSVKVCSSATQNTNSNSGCQSYSYKCVTNGTGCIEQPTCETSQFAIVCEGNSSCSSGQICLDRSSCSNYYNQSLCSLNQQQYKLGSKTYLRKCTWTSSCQNTQCSSLPPTLATDQDCDTALSGCITKGNGCVDINDNCSSYSGLITTCSKFKGLNGTQVCTQLASETNTSAPCVTLTQCSQAKLYSSVTQSSNSTCDTFLKGCFFNGADNCTNGDCTSYFGTLTTCQNINTAINSNKPQKCWKVDQPTNAATACIAKTCAHATVTASELFNTDPLCSNFLQGCVWNGKSTGGCQDSSTACTSYSGTTQSCGLFAQSGQKCIKTTGFCKFSMKPSKECAQNTIPSLSTDNEKSVYCQQFMSKGDIKANCIFNVAQCINAYAGYACTQFVASGSNDNEKNTYCSQLKYSNSQGFCAYLGGDKCGQQLCESILPTGTTTSEKQTYCQAISAQAMTDKKCFYDEITGYCSKPQPSCTGYTIPISIASSLLQKIQYCTIRSGDSKVNCTYSGTGATCKLSAGSCSDLDVSDPVLANKKLVCYNSLASNQKCSLRSDGTSCESFLCQTQIIELDPGVADTDVNRQQFCQTKFQIVCGYNKAIFTDKCISIGGCATKTYGPDDATNKQLCFKYISDGKPCAYESGDTCKEYNCDDVTSGMSVTTCAQYNSFCQYNGVKCIAKDYNCSNYVSEAAGSGKLANCSNLVQSTGEKCGYASPEAKCKIRACTDITTGGSDTFCSTYISNCVFDGVGCSLPPPCDMFTAFGSNQQEKGAFCNSRVAGMGGICTFVAGATKCQGPSASCDLYQISDFSGATPEVGCSLLIDANGLACQYNSGATCSDGDCSGASSTVNSDADCQSYKSFCKLDNSTPCSSKICSNAPTDITTDSACATYRFGCITNGKGCIESSSNCSDFKGTASTCANFIGNNGSQPCGNSISAVATDSCANRACDQNSSAKNDQDCDKWIPPTGTVKNCVWNGSTGCAKPQNCSLFQGTIDTCPKFTALDGPCSGSGTTVSACATYNCLNAPVTHNTDAQCKSVGPNCMTNGFGCIPIGQCTSIALHTACPSYQNTLGCDLAKTCRTKPQQCGDFTTATECNNTPIFGLTLPGCGWNVKTSVCGPLICVNLPLTLTTDQQCSQSISNCTTTGSGCIVKGACSTYSKLVCGIAATTDMQKVCIWSNTVCRPIQCTDNITATSDGACDAYLTGCKTTGTGCGFNLTCPQYTSQQSCNKDYNGNPCIWLQTQTTKSCINYTKCSDVISNSHKDCQNISPQCTTNGINCIAITSCAKTIAQASCVIGTDGNCGWLPASVSTNANCALFTNCTAAIGKTTQQCQAWSNTCISDGVSCISKSQCSSYQTQQACQSLGTDGTCIWIADQTSQSTGTCRLQVCSDAATNKDTHIGCFAFAATTKCTTSGTACIQLNTCSQYKVQAGCVLGTDGDCFWQTPQANSTDAPICRLKQCSDNILTTSSACLNSIAGLKCVSNGVNCIKQSTCSTYTSKEACIGGGTDGQCAFTPDSTTSANGKCQLFQSCENANQDQLTCNSRQDSCYFNSTTNNGTTTTQCQPQTCQTKAQTSSCQPVPSFDLQTYQICVLTDGKCLSGSPSLFTAANCYSNSVATYTWNPITSKCSECKQGSSIANNTNNQTNSSNLQSQLVGFVIFMAIANI